MSETTFVEAESNDPYVRELHRRAVRLLNDPCLDRWQRERHVRRLQGLLQEHQAKQDAKAKRAAEKKVQREQVSRTNRDQKVAHPSQVVARRREFKSAGDESGAKGIEVKALPTAAANDGELTGRSRPVLTLKRA